MGFKVRSGGVCGSGCFSGCFAVDSAVHKSLLPTPLSFHYCATQPSKHLEPVATLIRLFHCYCNFMGKVITANSGGVGSVATR